MTPDEVMEIGSQIMNQLDQYKEMRTVMIIGYQDTTKDPSRGRFKLFTHAAITNSELSSLLKNLSRLLDRGEYKDHTDFSNTKH